MYARLLEQDSPTRTPEGLFAAVILGLDIADDMQLPLYKEMKESAVEEVLRVMEDNSLARLPADIDADALTFITQAIYICRPEAIFMVGEFDCTNLPLLFAFCMHVCASPCIRRIFRQLAMFREQGDMCDAVIERMTSAITWARSPPSPARAPP
jgi:hypothetical protein